MMPGTAAYSTVCAVRLDRHSMLYKVRILLVSAAMHKSATTEHGGFNARGSPHLLLSQERKSCVPPYAPC